MPFCEPSVWAFGWIFRIGFQTPPHGDPQNDFRSLTGEYVRGNRATKAALQKMQLILNHRLARALEAIGTCDQCGSTAHRLFKQHSSHSTFSGRQGSYCRNQ
jgi:hypothetical protein